MPTSAGAACPKLPEPPPAPSLTTLLAPLWQPGSTALPQSSDDVVRTLREQFEGPTEHSADPFAALRSAASASRALHPDALPAEMPAFVLPGHTLLPGEHASFVFFEPRYRRMCELALGGTPPDGRFVHLAARRIKSDFAPVGTLVSILRHERLDDGRYAAECLAGPRVQVVAQRDEELPRGDPLLHVSLGRPPTGGSNPRAGRERAPRPGAGHHAHAHASPCLRSLGQRRTLTTRRPPPPPP